MNANEILETMYDMVDRALSMPLSNKCMIDGEKFKSLINEVRLNLPSEIKHAKMIVADRTQIISDAKRESESIISNAEQRAKRMVDEQDIVKRAREQSNQMVSEAYAQAREIKRTSSEFVDDMLKHAEEVFAKGLAEAKETRHNFKKMSSSRKNNKG